MIPAGIQEFSALVARARGNAGIPGLAAAARYGDRTVSAAAGVLNVDTGVEVRPDSLFQVGSITKSHTATLIMQAMEEGLIDIDAPVGKYISLPLGRGDHANRFSARQLMAHVSGLDGDLFLDTGRDDDALARYMVLCEQLEFLSAPGRYYSYCNAGYAILGRLLEIVRKQTFDDILQQCLLAPVGAARSTTFAEEAVFRRTAVGHVPTDDKTSAVAPLVCLPRAMGPAGLTLYSTVEDLIRYADAHMSGNGVISQTAAVAMRTPHVSLPDDTAWGLGWKLIERDGTRFVGHDGGTIGQTALLWFAPDHNLAVAMCGNGGNLRQAWEEVAFPLFRETCGSVPEPVIPEPVRDQTDLSRYIGVFDNVGVSMLITKDGDRLKVVARQKFLSLPDVTFYMQPLGDDRFRVSIGDDDKVVTAFFDEGNDGKHELFYAGRMHRRRPGTG